MKRGRIPRHLEHLVSQTVKNYLHARENVQRFINRTNMIQGRCGEYVFQSSHGTQQIKKYEPKKYKNGVNTPLRIRTRTIMRLASEDPTPTKEEKLRYLYRSYPFYLDKDQVINLRMRNFYFDRWVNHSVVSIYRKRPGEEPDPEMDELYETLEYMPKKTIKFEHQEEDEERYYAVHQRSGEISNVLHFVWQEV